MHDDRGYRRMSYDNDPRTRCNCREASLYEEILSLYSNLLTGKFLDSRGVLNSDGRKLLAKMGKLIGRRAKHLSRKIWKLMEDPNLQAICSTISRLLESANILQCLETCKPRAAQTVRETVIACGNSTNPAALIAVKLYNSRLEELNH
ncbi:MAG: hypothetical protein F7C07_04365 [Desulfurococcales archaeon]|nr:hypothetical protein [Desulfurococcales archaeon]